MRSGNDLALHIDEALRVPVVQGAAQRNCFIKHLVPLQQMISMSVERVVEPRHWSADWMLGACRLAATIVAVSQTRLIQVAV